MGRCLEDGLHVASHVHLGEHAITLVQHKVLHVRQIHHLLLGREVEDTTGSAHHDLGLLVGKGIRVELDVYTAIEHHALDLGQVLTESLVLSLDLVGELAGVAEDKDRYFSWNGYKLVEGRQHEDGRLAHPRLGLADDIHAQHCLGDALVLN